MIIPVALLILALIAAGFVWLTIAHARDHVKTHGIHRITFRMLTGRRTDGKRHTNASFWRKSDGRVTGHPVGRVSARHHRAGVANLIRTLAWVSGILGSLWGMTQDFRLTVIGDSVVAVALIGWKGYRLIKYLRRWYMGRNVVTPLADALAPVFEVTGPEMETRIHLEPDYLTRKTGQIGVIDVPTKFAAAPAEMDMVRHVFGRFPVGVDVTPRMGGRAPRILISAAPELPSIVPFSRYTRQIEALGPGKYLAGITRSGEPYSVAFDGEDPHHGYCWGSGRGKSTILKSIVAQVFHNEPDSTGTVIDPKEVSLDAFQGIPGLTFFNEIEDFEGPRNPAITMDTLEDYMPGQWHGVKSVYDLMKQRYAILRRDPTAEFPTHLLIMEEANSFAIMSKIWWQKNKPKGVNAATPPIWAEYIAPIFWRGRQCNIKIVLVAQTIQERFLGSINLRPSLGVISMSGFKANQWMNYIGTSPVPRAQKGKGRAIYAVGESETWVQTFLGKDDELRAFAMAGREGKRFPVFGAAEPIITREPGARRDSVTLWTPDRGLVDVSDGGGQAAPEPADGGPPWSPANRPDAG